MWRVRGGEGERWELQAPPPASVREALLLFVSCFIILNKNLINKEVCLFNFESPGEYHRPDWRTEGQQSSISERPCIPLETTRTWS